MNYYSGYIYNDTGNGVGIRTTLFLSGCTRHCKNCHNPQSWNFENGEILSQEKIDEIIASLEPKWIDGLTISGGDPLEPRNRNITLHLINLVRERYGETKSIWVYTGYTYPELIEEDEQRVIDILNNINVLIDGPYIEEMATPTLQFRGSTNQNWIEFKEKGTM